MLEISRVDKRERIHRQAADGGCTAFIHPTKCPLCSGPPRQMAPELRDFTSRRQRAFEAKNKLSALLNRVEAGEEIVITRRGKPVARLISANLTADLRNRGADAAARIRSRAKKAGLAPITWGEWKGMRDEGRR